MLHITFKSHCTTSSFVKLTNRSDCHKATHWSLSGVWTLKLAQLQWPSVTTTLQPSKCAVCVSYLLHCHLSVNTDYSGFDRLSGLEKTYCCKNEGSLQHASWKNFVSRISTPLKRRKFQLLEELSTECPWRKQLKDAFILIPSYLWSLQMFFLFFLTKRRFTLETLTSNFTRSNRTNTYHYICN